MSVNEAEREEPQENGSESSNTDPHSETKQQQSVGEYCGHAETDVGDQSENPGSCEGLCLFYQ